MKDECYHKLAGRVPARFLDLDSPGVPAPVVQRSVASLKHHFDFACHIGYNSIVLPRIQSAEPANLAAFLASVSLLIPHSRYTRRVWTTSWKWCWRSPSTIKWSGKAGNSFAGT